MKVIAHLCNIILWVLVGIVVFQNYTDITIGLLARLGDLRFICDMFGLFTLVLDLLVYTGVMGPKNNTNAGISAIFMLWIGVIILCKYVLKPTGIGWLYSAWDVLTLGFAMPYLTLRGKK